MNRTSHRQKLRAFQAMRGEQPDMGFVADLEYLQNRDLDLSVRLGAVLAFNALMITIGTHPVSASPGAPLSVDAATQPAQTIASLVGVAPLIVSSYFCLRAILLGEEYDQEGLEDETVLRQRLFAAFVRSIDAQIRLVRHAVHWTFVGGGATILVWLWILLAKMT